MITLLSLVEQSTLSGKTLWVLSSFRVMTLLLCRQGGGLFLCFQNDGLLLV